MRSPCACKPLLNRSPKQSPAAPPAARLLPRDGSQPSGSPQHPGYSQTPLGRGGLKKPPAVGCELHPPPPTEGLQFGEAQQPPRPPHEPGCRGSASIRRRHRPLPHRSFSGRGEGAGSEHPALGGEIFWGEGQPAAWGTWEQASCRVRHLRAFGGGYFTDAEAAPKPCCSLLPC